MGCYEYCFDCISKFYKNYFLVIDLVPINTLTGILFIVVLETFSWQSLNLIVKRKIKILDSLVIILTTLLAVMVVKYTNTNKF